MSQITTVSARYLDRLETENARLRAALVPFADAGRRWAAKDYIAACEAAKTALGTDDNQDGET